MSDALHFIRLRWHDGHGLAKLHDREVLLTEPPDLGDGQVYEVDFAPYLRCWELRQHPWSDKGEMSDQQMRAARRLIEQLCGGEDAAVR